MATDKPAPLEGAMLEEFWRLVAQLESTRLTLATYGIRATVSQAFPQAPIKGSVVKHYPEPKETEL